MLPEPEPLRFASDATIAGLWAAACFIGAGITIWADRRRIRRRHIDRAGWVPWPKLFFAFALVGVVLLTMAVKGWVSR
jgi:hypothetical protein